MDSLANFSGFTSLFLSLAYHPIVFASCTVASMPCYGMVTVDFLSDLVPWNSLAFHPFSLLKHPHTRLVELSDE